MCVRDGRGGRGKGLKKLAHMSVGADKSIILRTGQQAGPSDEKVGVAVLSLKSVG